MPGSECSRSLVSRCYASTPMESVSRDYPSETHRDGPSTCPKSQGAMPVARLCYVFPVVLKGELRASARAPRSIERKCVRGSRYGEVVQQREGLRVYLSVRWRGRLRPLLGHRDGR